MNESVEATNNKGQFKLSFINEVGVIETKGTVVTKERFLRIVDMHKDIYRNAEFFWDMLERDLFEESK